MIEFGKGRALHPDDCRSQIRSDFGEDVLRDMATLVGRAYPRAHREVQDRYGDTIIARDLYPIERRAMIEEKFALLPTRHPQLRVVPATNKKETSHYFQLSHNRSVLTQSKTEGPRSLPRDADFRRTLAKTPQLGFGLSDGESAAVVEQADGVYGVLVHGPDEDDNAEVAFIRILIPDAAGPKNPCAHRPFPLLERRPIPRCLPDGANHPGCSEAQG